jgi:hypothetical protein
MDFKELMARMVELDQPVQEADTSDKDYDGDGEVESGKDEYMGSRDKAIKKAMGNDDDEETKESLDELADEVQRDMDECGLPGMSTMPSGMMGDRAPKQQDSVSMNLSMNGSGSGGIRDLMDILRNLDDTGSSHDHDSDMGLDLDLDSPKLMIAKKEPVLGDEYANSPDVQMGQDNFPIDHGDDLHKPKASYSDKPYRGDNPMAVEGIKNRLDSLYNNIKNQ